MSPPPVLAVDTYRDNGELIVAAARLGHLRANWTTLDLTYGKGTFWKRWKPDLLEAHDWERGQRITFRRGQRTGEECDRDSLDFRNVAATMGRWDVVVLDPPYGLRGTINETNGGYGLGEYQSVEDRHKMICEGVRAACQVANSRVLVKCQDQVCCQRIWWQTRIFTEAAERAGWTLIERLDMTGGFRPQPRRECWWCRECDKKVPEGHGHGRGQPRPALERRPSRQEHAYGRPSTLLIFGRGRL